MDQRNREVAEKLRQLLIDSSELIEDYTRKVCPDCMDLCCKQKHGALDPIDMLYLSALGTALPPFDPARPPEAPCQCLGAAGCARPRWLRPWKCTWYFCEPLLKILGAEPRKRTGVLTTLINEILFLRNELRNIE